MIFTWIKNGKPDVSMSLNASLAGLVAVTAGCDVVDALGSCLIGAVSGILVVVAVEFIDIKLKVDDPVGAVAVHCVNGMWGTIAVGLFATTSVPGNDSFKGLFYGGGITAFIGAIMVGPRIGKYVEDKKISQTDTEMISAWLNGINAIREG